MEKETLFRIAATVAARVPGADVCGVEAVDSWYHGFSGARILCSNGRDLLVTIAEPEQKLELERALVLETAIKNSVDPMIADVAGGRPVARISLPDDSTLLVHEAPAAAPLNEYSLTSKEAGSALGRCLAALHDARVSHIAALGVEVYDPDGWAERLAKQLTLATASGGIAMNVRDYFTEAFDQWPDFRPSCLHGDLNESCIYLSGDHVSALVGMSSTFIGDPAHDLAWVCAAGSNAFSTACFESYRRYGDAWDQSLEVRARILSMFQPISYLAYGVSHNDAEIVADARLLVAEIDINVLEQQSY